MYTQHMSIPNMIDFSLPPETPHPLAGNVSQVFHTPTSVWIYRETDSHQVSTETGEVLSSFTYDKLIDHNDRVFKINSPCRFWRSPDGARVSRLRQAPDSMLRLTTHDTKTGDQLWEKEIYIEPSDMEGIPHLGPQYPELFCASGTVDVVVCSLYRDNKTHGLLVHRIAKENGKLVWTRKIEEGSIDLLRAEQFDGPFWTASTVGFIDLESGEVHQTDPLPDQPVWPTRVGDKIYFPSVSSSSATAWETDIYCSSLDPIIRVDQKRITEAQVYTADNQPVLRINQNTLWFKSTKGKETQIKFKPWVYGVAASVGGPLFVMTDGNGGRMLAYDRANGKELLNLKPTIGGYGSHAFLENHALIVAAEVTKRDWSQRALRIFSTTNCKHTLLPIGGYLLSAHHDHALIQARDSQDPNSFTLLDLREARSLL